MSSALSIGRRPLGRLSRVVRLVVLALVASVLAFVAPAVSSAASASAPGKLPTHSGPKPTFTAPGVEAGSAGSSVIKGLVYDDDGRLLDNIDVEAFASTDLNADPVASDLTYEYENAASHGAYELHVPAGDYILRFSSLDSARDVYETVFYGGGAGTPVHVGSSDTVTLDDVVLVHDTGAPVSGTVRAPDGTPLAGAEVDLVRIYADGHPGVVDSEETDANGRYTFEGVNRGRAYTVQASYYAEYDDDTWTYLPNIYLGQQLAVSLAQQFTLPRGSAGTTLGAITLKDTVAVTGRVVNAAGAAVGYADVWAYTFAGDDSYQVTDGEAGASGAFTLYLTSGFTYTLSTYGRGKEETYLGDVIDLANATRFALTSARDVGTIQVGLKGSVVRLKVIDADGDPTSEADVIVWRRQGDHFVNAGYAREGRTGSFERRLDWGSEYTFEARTWPSSGDGYTSTFLGGASTVAAALTVRPTEAQPTIDAGTITLPSTPPGKLRGLVETDGAPLPGAEVVLYARYAGCTATDEADCWDWLRRDVADAAGKYQFSISPWYAERYSSFTVRAGGDDLGYAERYAGGGTSVAGATTYPAPAAGAVTTVETIALTSEPLTLRGTVDVPGAAGFEGEASVSLYCWNEQYGYWNFERSTWTSSGRYALQVGEPKDACLVEVWYYDAAGEQWFGSTVPGEWPAEDVTAAPGVFAVGDLTTTAPAVTVHRLASISGAITAPEGDTLRGEFQVTLYRWHPGGWEQESSTWTDEPYFRFNGVDPATYAVRVTYEPYDKDSPYDFSWSGPAGRPEGPGADGTVDLAASAHATLDVRLKPPGKIRGTVVDAAGPVADARVRIYGKSCSVFWCFPQLLGLTKTDADGAYSFTPGPDISFYSDVSASAEKMSVGYLETFPGGSADSWNSGFVPRVGGDTVLDPITLALRPGTLVGTLTTEDGESLDESSTSLTLYRWNADNERFEWVTSTTSDGADGFSWTDLGPGTYSLLASNYRYDGTIRYLPTLYGGGYNASGPGADAASFTISGDANPTQVSLELRRGVGLSGSVTAAGETGAPVAGAEVNLYGETSSGLSVFGSAFSDADGRYEVRLPAGSHITQVDVTRTGFDPVNEHSADPSLITVGDGDATYDISLNPRWGRIGAVAGVRDPSCLSHESYGDDLVTFGGRSLRLGWDSITRAEDENVSLASLANSAPILSPLTDNYASNPTWGIADGVLCVQWGLTGGDDTPVYQARLRPASAGGLDVVYNYDSIPSAWPGARAGYADGLRSFGRRVVFPGAGVGYGDEEPRALIDHSLGSTTVGRYAFHFEGFEPRAAAPYGSVKITGVRGVGKTLTATPGAWYDEETGDRVDADDIEFRYRWSRGSTTLGTGQTYLIKESDYGLAVRVRIDASVAGHQIGTATKAVRITAGSPAATATSAPTLSPMSPTVGSAITLEPGSWTPAGGLTAGDLAFSYRWYRNGKRIAGVSGTTYDVAGSDAGQRISADVTVTAPGFGDVTRAADAVTVAELPMLSPTRVPSIVGTAKVGQTLTVDPGEWSDAGPLADALALSTPAVSGVTYSYQWYVGWRQRTTADSYTVTAADVGEYVTVTVTARAPGHRDGSASASTGPVLRADAQIRTVTVKVVDAETKAGVPSAWVSVCEQVEWTCLAGGVTNGDGVYTGAALVGREYSVSAYPAAPYRSAVGTISAADPQVTLQVTKPAPPPPNVAIPSSNGTVDGSTPMVYWQEDQQFDVTGCATTPNPAYTVKFTDGTPDKTGALVKQGPESDGIVKFHATIPAFYPSHGDITIETNVPANCAPGTAPTKVNVYIDPSGIVTDQYGRGIQDAKVTLLRSDNAGGPYTKVPDGSDIMSPANRANPSLTDATGFFRWDVGEGWYRVKAEATGCSSATTDAMQVPPPRVDLLIKLQCADVAAPTATPTISGTRSVGSVVSTDTGIWGRDLDNVSVQWLRDGDRIDGATHRTYTLTAADSGHELSVQQVAKRTSYTQEEGRGVPVSFTSVTGTSSAASIPRDTTPDATPLVASTAPTLTGSGKVGSTLTATAPVWSAAGATTTQKWYVGDVLVPTATGLTYQPTAADVGKSVKVAFVGSKAGFLDSAPVSPAPVTVVAGDAPAVTKAPVIAGTALVGKTLIANPGTWSASGLTFAYQWKRAGVAIPGATKSTYAASVSDLGKALTVTVTAKRDGYGDGVASSAPVRVKRASTATLAAPKSAKASKKVKLTAVVKVAGVAKPTGTVTLYDGKKKLKAVTLTAKSKGKVVFSIAFKAGSHPLKAVYSGTGDAAGATSKVATVKVAKAKKKRREAAPSRELSVPELLGFL